MSAVRRGTCASFSVRSRAETRARRPRGGAAQQLPSARRPIAARRVDDHTIPSSLRDHGRVTGPVRSDHTRTLDCSPSRNAARTFLPPPAYEARDPLERTGNRGSALRKVFRVLLLEHRRLTTHTVLPSRRRRRPRRYGDLGLCRSPRHRNEPVHRLRRARCLPSLPRSPCAGIIGLGGTGRSFSSCSKPIRGSTSVGHTGLLCRLLRNLQELAGPLA